MPIRAASIALAALLAGCGVPPQGVTPYAPTADMRDVLVAQARLGVQPVETLSVADARLAPDMADAVRLVQAGRLVPVAAVPAANVRDIGIAGAAGMLAARVYTPAGIEAAGLPVVVFFHDGGWVAGSLETGDATARGLAAGAGAVVLSVAYRQGPEDRFPAAHEDANAAYRWVLTNAASVGGDARRIALAGEGAGGNLALNAALFARAQGLARPVHVLLIEPVAGTSLDTPSAIENAGARPLGAAGVAWLLQHYARGPADLRDVRLDAVGNVALAGLPPVTIVLAQIDPLRSGGEALVRRLVEAGVTTEVTAIPGVTHGFFGTGAVVPAAREAMAFVTDRLRAAFAVAPMPEPPLPPVRRGGRRRR